MHFFLLQNDLFLPTRGKNKTPLGQDKSFLCYVSTMTGKDTLILLKNWVTSQNPTGFCGHST